MHFIHIADVHLGYHQYGLDARFDDFGQAFRWSIEWAVREAVDAILIAGDLFEKSTVPPQAYLQAATILGRAREARIPVVAITGNHDRARYLDQISWLDVLAEEGYLTLLQPTLTKDAGGADGRVRTLTPWDGHSGGYIDLGELRVIGVPWGAAGPWWPQMVEAIRSLLPRRHTVLLAHTGLEGEMGNRRGGLSYAQLAPLRDCVDYVALGHFHKPFERDGWIFNPGSLEHCAMGERNWKKGIYDVVLDGEGFTARHVASSPRPFFRESLRVDEYRTPAALLEAVRALAHERAGRWSADGRAPVVELALEGTLAFDRTALDLIALQDALRGAGDLLRASIATDGLTLRGMEVADAERLPRDVLERDVLRELALNDARYAARADDWVETMLAIKDLALRGATPEAIVETLGERMATMEEGEDHGD